MKGIEVIEAAGTARPSSGDNQKKRKAYLHIRSSGYANDAHVLAAWRIS